MSSMKSKLRCTGAIAVLCLLALAASCRGFFVKPTLTSLAVGPVSPTIYVGNVNNTVQMFAVGTFNDGSNSNNTPVSWSVSGTNATTNQPIATISASGLVTAQASGSGTVTATSNVLPSISGTQPITVSIACTSAPIVSPTSGTLTPQQTSIIFTATCNGGVDISSVATWFPSNNTIANFSGNVLTATGTANGSFYITASANGFTSQQIQLSASGF